MTYKVNLNIYKYKIYLIGDFMSCNWNRCKRCGKVSESEYCIKCKRKLSKRKRFKKNLENN